MIHSPNDGGSLRCSVFSQSQSTRVHPSEILRPGAVAFRAFAESDAVIVGNNEHSPTWLRGTEGGSG